MRAYGDREGLAESLATWVKRLSTDKSFPWPGSGIIADLKTAVAVLNGEPEAPKNVEYDL